jgi:Berberine and berberine like
VATAGPDSDSPLLSVEIRHCGGAMAAGTDGGAQSGIDAGYMVFGVGLTPTPEIADAVRSHVRVVLDTLAPWRAEFDYYNLREMAADADEVLPRDSYHRLREIKAKYDPDEVIVSAHPVRPAR